MCKKADIFMGSKIWDSCKKRLVKLPNVETDLKSPAKCDSHLQEEQYLDVPEATAAMNKFSFKIGETPLSKSVSHNPKHVEGKIEKSS